LLEVMNVEGGFVRIHLPQYIGCTCSKLKDIVLLSNGLCYTMVKYKHVLWVN